MSDPKYVYFFAANQSEGKAEMKNLLGGKGANLAEMCNIGVPVPPGFTLSTEVCTAYYDNNKNYPPALRLKLKLQLLRQRRYWARNSVILQIHCYCQYDQVQEYLCLA
jgi:phosphoenolpyruvate synthase/pyruvate phosphate dikinase